MTTIARNTEPEDKNTVSVERLEIEKYIQYDRRRGGEFAERIINLYLGAAEEKAEAVALANQIVYDMFATGSIYNLMGLVVISGTLELQSLP